MNRNIIDTIISKTTFPIVSLEYGYKYITTDKHNASDFNAKFFYGLYRTKVDIEKGISEIRRLYNIEHAAELYITIKMIENYGKVIEPDVEEYMYYKSEKYRRIYRIPDPKIDDRGQKIGFYEYKKIE